MSLLGRGALANWGGVIAAADSDYNDWHSREHMPERLAVPGFRRGRRCIGVAGTPEPLRYFMLYEVDTPQVLVSGPYLARLDDPTPWTRRILAQYVAPCRTVCTVAMTGGCGVGGYTASVRFAPSDPEAACAEACTWVPRLLALPGIVAAHVLRGERTLGQQPTAEKRFREAQGEPDRTTDLAFLIDGLDEADTTAAMRELLGLAGDGIGGERIATVYRLQHVLVREDAIRSQEHG
jgi:hypothetical protein